MDKLPSRVINVNSALPGSRMRVTLYLVVSAILFISMVVGQSKPPQKMKKKQLVKLVNQLRDDLEEARAAAQETRLQLSKLQRKAKRLTRDLRESEHIPLCARWGRVLADLMVSSHTPLCARWGRVQAGLVVSSHTLSMC